MAWRPSSSGTGGPDICAPSTHPRSCPSTDAMNSAVCLTSAVPAPVLRARPARFNESLFEGRPGAKDAYPGIADREIPLRGEVFHRRALHINRLQCIGVL